MRKRPPLKAVFWDLDGTAVDTEEPFHASVVNLAASLGVRLPSGVWNLIHMTGTDPYAVLAKKYQCVVQEQQVEDVRGFVRNAVRDSRFMPGFIELHHGLWEAGITQVLITNGDDDWLEFVNDALGFSDAADVTHLTAMFDLVKTCARKPQSVAVQSALNELGLNPDEVVSIEDTPWGVAAAIGAGTTPLYVPSGHYKEQHLPDVARSSSLEGLTPERLSLLRPLPARSLEWAMA